MCVRWNVWLACALFALPALGQNHEVEIAGKTLSCGSARIYQDRSLPNMGVAIPTLNRIVLNPDEMSRERKEVRWFIFYHECGHIQGHLNEKKADAYAVERASKEGWLTQDVLAQICRSYGPMNAPATSTHPAPRDRCNAVMAVAARHQRPSGDPSVGTMVTLGPKPETPKRTPASPAPNPGSSGTQFILGGIPLATR